MLTINQRSSEVTIEGIAEYAMSAKQNAIDWIRKFTDTRHCQEMAEIIKEQVQWFMKVCICFVLFLPASPKESLSPSVRPSQQGSTYLV
jgi:hypothetical protein